MLLSYNSNEYCIQAAGDFLALELESGDLKRKDLTMNAIEGESRAEAVAAVELERLNRLARRFRVPGKGSRLVYFERLEGDWVAHEMRVDAAGSLYIKTRASY